MVTESLEVSVSDILNMLVADCSPLYCKGVELALQSSGRTCQVQTVKSFDELEAAISQNSKLDLLVVDAGLPGLNTFFQLRRSLCDSAELPVLMLVELCSPAFVHKAFRFGARGVALKSSSRSELNKAVDTVLNEGQWRPVQDNHMWLNVSENNYLIDALVLLSDREKCVLKHLKDGLPNKQIAWHMSLTEPTVKSHVSRIYRKLNMKNRTRLALTIQQMEPAGIERYGLA